MRQPRLTAYVRKYHLPESDEKGFGYLIVSLVMAAISLVASTDCVFAVQLSRPSQRLQVALNRTNLMSRLVEYEVVQIFASQGIQLQNSPFGR